MSPPVTRWWDRPQLRRDEDEGRKRKVGFIELFYDLIFVVAVAQLAHGLAEHPDWRGVATFALLFVPVWWLWIGNTFYTDRFETEDLSHLLFTFLQMIPVVGLAVFAHDGLQDTATGFAVSYIAGRILIIFLWWRGGHHNAAARPATNGYVRGFSVGVSFWIAGLFVDDHLRIAFWIVGLAIDLATPALLVRNLRLLPRFSHSKLAERFGLFAIIVLGESVAGTVNGLAQTHDLHMAQLLTGFLAMALALALWFLYFEMVPRHQLQPGFWPTLLRSYIHLPLLASLAATGAGVLGVVGQEGQVLSMGPRYVLTGSVTLAFLTLIGLSRIHVYQPMFAGARLRTESSLLFGIVATIALALFGADWNALALLGALVFVTVLPSLLGIWTWAHAPGADETDFEV